MSHAAVHRHDLFASFAILGTEPPHFSGLARRWRRLAATRRYLPANVPLVKRVAAAPGDRVCAVGGRILANGRRIAERRAVDGLGRPMPWWTGCTVPGDGALLLLMDDPASFDGRYFGPVTRGDIIGRARLLWHS